MLPTTYICICLVCNTLSKRVSRYWQPRRADGALCPKKEFCPKYASHRGNQWRALIGRYTDFPVRQIMWVYVIDSKNRVHAIFASQVSLHNTIRCNGHFREGGNRFKGCLTYVEHGRPSTNPPPPTTHTHFSVACYYIRSSTWRVDNTPGPRPSPCVCRFATVLFRYKEPRLMVDASLWFLASAVHWKTLERSSQKRKKSMCN